MARVKTKNLFNRNHVSIVKKEGVLNQSQWSEIEYRPGETSGYKKRQKIVQTLESPLGFYYTKETWIGGDNYDSLLLRKLTVTLKKEVYEVSYYTTNYNRNQTRPWEIVEGDLGLSDQLVDKLKEELDKVISVIEDNKLVTIDRESTRFSSLTAKELREKLYLEIFGDKKGPRYQTDREKIVSHGFDLKTSFRNV